MATHPAHSDHCHQRRGLLQKRTETTKEAQVFWMVDTRMEGGGSGGVTCRRLGISERCDHKAKEAEGKDDLNG